jgi:hypothetical protein
MSEGGGYGHHLCLREEAMVITCLREEAIVITYV